MARVGTETEPSAASAAEDAGVKASDTVETVHEGPGAEDAAAAEDAHFDRMLAVEAAAGARVAYGPRPDQFLEWFGDPLTAGTVVVLIHGGYFREQYTRSYMRPMARALVERGARAGAGAGVVRAGASASVAVALVEYRRVGGEGGHPRTIEDVEAAVAAVLDTTAVEAASRDVRLVVAGHSAGSSLALSWASRQPEVGPSVRVRPLAAVTDLVAEVRDNLGDGAVLAYMGAEPDVDPARYLAEDPRSRAALIPARFDVQLIHGTDDQTVSISFPRGFPAQLWELDHADHFDVVDPHSPHFEEVARLLVD